MSYNQPQEKIVIVTGSTSGIGLGIAKTFAAEKMHIILNGFVKDNELQTIKNDLQSLGALSIKYYPTDLAKPVEIDEMFQDITASYNKIDILVNNAGIQFVSPIEDFPAEKLESIIRINLLAAFYTIKNAVPIIKQHKTGRIINIASAHALVASPFKSAYVAAKHGVLGLTKTVALELAEYGITVNAVCPGYVKTPLVLSQISDQAKARHITEEEVVNKVLLGAQPTKRFVEIEEVAKLVKFLASDSASSITGAALSIDGGWTAQ